MNRLPARLGALALLLGLAACGGRIVDHERLGDEHLAAGRYAQAMDEYRTAQRTQPVARVWAKLGGAALRAGDLPTATEAYGQLAAADPARQQEAARGLERVIRAAARGGGSAMLGAAIVALRRAAPDRPLSRLARSPAGLADLEAAEAVRVLPSALGMADRPEEVDRLLVSYGRALQVTTACEAATPIFRTALRRAPGDRLGAEAAEGLASCALQLGLDALAAGQAAMAEDWLGTAMLADASGPVGLRARIGLGEARLAQGDVLGAAIWWSTVVSAAGAPDSLTALATQRLNGLAAAGPPEEGRP